MNDEQNQRPRHSSLLYLLPLVPGSAVLPEGRLRTVRLMSTPQEERSLVEETREYNRLAKRRERDRKRAAAKAAK